MKLRTLFVAIMILGAMANFAFGVQTNPSQTFNPAMATSEKATAPSDVWTPQPQPIGEDMSNAKPITGLPYNDSGNTSGFRNDYGAEDYPSSSPDVVYKYTPASDENVTLSLCGGTAYDAAMFVMDDENTIIASSDDACGLEPEITALNLAGGNTYYIVVEGYGQNCGYYLLNLMRENLGICFECPPGARIEDEPICGPDYVDNYDGGCNWDPYRFLPIDCGYICGETGTYLLQGSSYRDTDWYVITVTEPATYRGVGDGFPLRLFVLPAVCPDPGGPYNTTVAPSCVWSDPLFFGPGTYYLWAGPDVFSDVPCGSKYLLEVVCRTTATENTTWGKVKGLFR